MPKACDELSEECSLDILSTGGLKSLPSMKRRETTMTGRRNRSLSGTTSLQMRSDEDDYQQGYAPTIGLTHPRTQPFV